MPKEPKTSYDRFVARVRRHDGGNRSVDRGLENNVPIPNAILFPLLIQDVQKGKTCTLRLRGNSMRPFLENERDLAIFTTPEGVKVGDPVLAEIEKGHYVLHRIMKIEDVDSVEEMSEIMEEAQEWAEKAKKNGSFLDLDDGDDDDDDDDDDYGYGYDDDNDDDDDDYDW